MLNIKNLSVYLLKDLKILIDDFSFSLNEGDKIGLIGEEGNGKSTLLKAIVGDEDLKQYTKITGTIDKKDEVIGYLPQILKSEDLEKTTEEYFNEKIPYEKMDYNRYYKLLLEIDFDEEKINNKIKLKNLSGGEKIKYILFIEMMKNPTIILLDEPTNDLDIKSIEWLEKFLNNINIPIMLISHDEMFLGNVVNGIIHFEQIANRKEAKHTISGLDYFSYIENRIDNIERQEQKAKKDKENFDKKMYKFRKVHDSVQDDLRKTKPNNPAKGKSLKDKMHTLKAMEKRYNKEKENLTEKPNYEEQIYVQFNSDLEIPIDKEILDFKLDKLEIDGKLLSKNIELKLYGPKKICIIGENGSGKSTLLKQIVKELKKTNFKYGYMPQNYRDGFDLEKTPIDFIEEKANKEEHTKISTYLGSLNFSRDEMQRKLKNLSGGQKAKTYFAKMSYNNAEVLVLDEPTRNISPLSAARIREMFKKYNGAIIAVSHDRLFINEVFDEVYELTKNGLKKI